MLTTELETHSISKMHFFLLHVLSIVRSVTKLHPAFSPEPRLQPADALLEPGLPAGLALQQPEPRVAAGAARPAEAPHPRLHAQPQPQGPRRRRRAAGRRAGAAGRPRPRREEGLRVGHAGPRRCGGGGRAGPVRPLQAAHDLGSEAAAAAAAGAPGAGEPAADAAASEGVQHAEGR